MSVDIVVASKTTMAHMDFRSYLTSARKQLFINWSLLSMRVMLPTCPLVWTSGVVMPG